MWENAWRGLGSVLSSLNGNFDKTSGLAYPIRGHYTIIGSSIGAL